MTDDAGRRQVVIVGGGFAGLFVARTLRRANVRITLIDREQHHLFQPLLYQCAAGILSEGEIAVPLRDLLKRHKNVDCVLAEVTDFDVAGRRVIANRIGGEHLEYPYDDLIVAAGVQQSYFGHDEYAGVAPGMKSLEDALAIRRRVYGAFEMADTATDPVERTAWLTFALVGAGPTGVELAGQIRELATKTLRKEYRTIMPGDARVLLFDGGSAPLASFGPKLSQRAATILQDLGVEQHMGTIATKVDINGLEVRDHSGAQTRYDARTVLWTAGVEAPDVAGALARATGASQDRAGRILVQPDLTVAGHPEIFVAGDMMSLNKLPGVAEVAMQAGIYAARRIKRRAAGGENGEADQKPFQYRDLGTAAYISRGRAVVQAGPLKTGGFIAWWIWLFIHIAFLTGYRNRVAAILTWWLAFTKDSRRERAFTIQEVRVFQDRYTKPIAIPQPDSAPGRPRPPSSESRAASSQSRPAGESRPARGDPPGRAQ